MRTILIIAMLAGLPIAAQAKNQVNNADEFVSKLNDDVGTFLDAQDDFQENLENMCTGKSLPDALLLIEAVQFKIKYGDSPSFEGYEVSIVDADGADVALSDERGHQLEGDELEAAAASASLVKVRIHRQFDSAVSRIEVEPTSLVCP